MNDEIRIEELKNENKKNSCKICGKKYFEEKNQLAACIKMKNGISICFSCAYNIEEALNAVDLAMDESLYEQEIYEDEPKVTAKKTAEKLSLAKELPTRKKIIEKLQGAIIGQNEAIVRVTNMLFRNIKTSNRELKSAPLLIGRSGEGKTEIITQLCNELEIPFVIENAKDFSEAGYTGRNPSEIFTDLYNTCGANVNIAQKGVIIIDEIDKLRSTSGAERDVSGSGVINTLLSYISGTKVPLKDRYDNIIGYINTKEITFIFMGAFEDDDSNDSIYSIRQKRLNKKSSKIGFGEEEKVDESKENLEKNIIPADIIKYGFSRQFAGRVSIVELNKLAEKDYMNILVNSTISVYNAFIDEFKSYEIEVVCSEELQQKIVTFAMKKNIGARGIKAACEQIFLTPLEEVENMSETGKIDFKRLILNDDIFENSKSYKFE